MSKITVKEYGLSERPQARKDCVKLNEFIYKKEIHWIGLVDIESAPLGVMLTVEGDWTLPNANVRDILNEVLEGRESELRNRADITDEIAAGNPVLEVLPNPITISDEEVREIVELCKYPEYTFVVKNDKETGRLFLMAEYMEPDVITGVPTLQKTRKWMLSPFMTKSEITQTAFKCILTSMEHRVREHFTYRDERVYSPHYDVEFLVELCKQNRFDEREDWYAEGRNEDKNESKTN